MTQSDKEFFESNKILKTINNEEINKIKEELLKKHIWTFDDILRFPGEENSYLIENFLWENQVIFIIAKDKVGKSILSKQMCCCLSSGTPFLDSYDIPRPIKVLYIQLEGSRDETKERLSKMSKALPVISDNFRYVFRAKLWLNVQADLDKLLYDIDSIDYKPEVVFIDPLYTAIKGSMSNDEVAGGIICSIRTIQEKYNCSVVIIHHEHKTIRDRNGNRINEGDEAIMGSSLFKNFANHVLRLSMDKKTKIRELTCDTQRNNKVVTNIKIKLVDDPLGFRIENNATSQMQTHVFNYLKVNGRSTAKEICEKAGLSCVNSTRNALTKLLSRKIVKRIKGKSENLWEVCNGTTILS